MADQYFNMIDAYERGRGQRRLRRVAGEAAGDGSYPMHNHHCDPTMSVTVES